MLSIRAGTPNCLFKTESSKKNFFLHQDLAKMLSVHLLAASLLNLLLNLFQDARLQFRYFSILAFKSANS
ncbi:hypothetical protein JTE90_005499 [Oedothorax gibbosus]|uniref:Uncharacterized protein n=1 Tax=Oedothorax gibbosus TaxID=931172 RepID=A0AAV6UTR0_9ARAC|nr:hypothetical protein JTE90_005499 [Oedothorax gibbosus]